MSYISDFHCHISLKPYNNPEIDSIWAFKRNPPPRNFLFFFNLFRALGLEKFYKTYATYTQTNLDNCAEGNLRLVICALYPLERQFVNRNNFISLVIANLILFRNAFPFVNLFRKKKNLLIALVRTFVGVSNEKANKIYDEQRRKSNLVDYFSDYLAELNYLVQAQNSSSSHPSFNAFNFKIAENYEEYQTYINNDQTICGILSLEGMHGLGVYKVKHLFSNRNIDNLGVVDKSIIKRTFVDHINLIKHNSSTTPFYITFAHHYNNLLCGHARSFGGIMKMFFNQKGGLNKGMTEFGKLIIERHLLSRDNGKRILIDVKHMSVKARRTYYEMVKEMRNNDDNVPIISSHSAVSSVATLDLAQRQKSNRKLDKYSYVSRWDVNLTNEDILEIYNSDGLIGILMHDGRMPGKIFKDKFKNAHNREEENMLHVQMFLTNIYHVIQVVFKNLGENAWNLITLGSDMDGVIDPFDNYNTASSLTQFRDDIKDYLMVYADIPEAYKIRDLFTKNGIISYETFHSLNQGLSFQEIMDRIFYKNLDFFLSKYFTNQYLNHS